MPSLSFLYPFNLLLLGLTLLPPLLHLIKQKRYRIQLFPDIRLIRKTEEESRRRFRLRDILLLILRMPALASLALAAAAPTIYPAKAPQGEAVKRTVILMDVGYPMDMTLNNGESKLELAKELVAQFISALPPQTKTALLSHPQLAEVGGLSWQEAYTLQNILPHLKSSPKPEDFPLAIAECVRLLGEEGGRIICPSDGRWLYGIDTPIDLGGCNLDLVLFNQSQPDASLRLLSVDTGEGILTVSLQAYARGMGGSALITVHSGKNEVQKRVELTDEVPQEVVLSIAGEDWGYAELTMEGDSLTWNNTVYFVAHRPPKVALLVPAYSEGYNPLARSLDLGEEDDRYRVTYISPHEITSLGLDTCLVIDEAMLSDVGLEELRGFLSTGGSILLAGDGLLQDRAEKLLIEALGVAPTASPKSGQFNITATGTNPNLIRPDFHLEEVQVTVSPHWQGPERVVLARLSDGSAAVVGGGSLLGGKMAALLIPLSRSYSNLTTSMVFLPLMDSLVKGICWQPTPHLQLGQQLVERKAELLLPLVNGETTGTIELPGIYHLSGGEGKEALAAVNVAGINPPIGNEQALKLVAGGFEGGGVKIDDPAEFSKKSRTARGYSLTAVLICLAFALLIAETLFFPPLGSGYSRG